MGSLARFYQPLLYPVRVPFRYCAANSRALRRTAALLNVFLVATPRQGLPFRTASEGGVFRSPIGEEFDDYAQATLPAPALALPATKTTEVLAEVATRAVQLA